MNDLLILGKSNASLSMILELLLSVKYRNISIIKNMEDTTSLEYNIPELRVSELHDTDVTQYDPSYHYFIGAFIYIGINYLS